MAEQLNIFDWMFMPILILPYLIIDLYHIATEIPEWERRGLDDETM